MNKEIARISKNTVHGTGDSIWYQGCPCPICLQKKQVVERFVNGFSYLPANWFQKIDPNHRPVPMWCTLFVPKDSADMSMIEKLLRTIEVEKDEDGKEYENCEEAMFRYHGWFEVAETGIWATHLDDELVLGIHGAGYSFQAEHWIKLYDALEYQWH